jgi:hypothetical protein
VAASSHLLEVVTAGRRNGSAGVAAAQTIFTQLNLFVRKFIVKNWLKPLRILG